MKDFINYLSDLIKKRFGNKKNPGVVGFWKEEHAFLKATEQIFSNASEIKPLAISPYPVHGLEKATKTPRSWIPWVTFLCAAFGFIFGLWFTWWTSSVSWPIIVGGKPMWSLPAFIPVIFELTILFAAVGSIVSMLIACMLPNIHPQTIDVDLTCNKFAIFISNANYSKEKAVSILKESGALEIKET